MKIRVIEVGKVKLSPIFKRRLKKLLQLVFEGEKGTLKELNIIFMGDSGIRKINREFLKKDRPTDVISFNLDPIGEIYISVDTARRKAREYGFDAEFELARYAVHGLLHILGFDHEDVKMAEEMSSREEKYLNLWQQL